MAVIQRMLNIDVKVINYIQQCVASTTPIIPAVFFFYCLANSHTYLSRQFPGMCLVHLRISTTALFPTGLIACALSMVVQLLRVGGRRVSENNGSHQINVAESGSN